MESHNLHVAPESKCLLLRLPVCASASLVCCTNPIGADEMELPGIFGSSFGSRRVNPSADLDEASLQEIARLTGGAYFRARNPQELANIYGMLDKLEPVEHEVSLYRPRQALGYLPLGAALVVSIALGLLSLRHSYSGRWAVASTSAGESA